MRNGIRTSRLFEFTGHHASKREWWENFFKQLPTDTDPLGYKAQLELLGIPFLQPCSAFMYDKNYISGHLDRSKWVLPHCGKGLEDIMPGFSLPEVFAVSGNCLTSDFNLHPVHPRLYSVRDATLQVQYKIN